MRITGKTPVNVVMLGVVMFVILTTLISVSAFSEFSFQ